MLKYLALLALVGSANAAGHADGCKALCGTEGSRHARAGHKAACEAACLDGTQAECLAAIDDLAKPKPAAPAASGSGSGGSADDGSGHRHARAAHLAKAWCEGSGGHRNARAAHSTKGKDAICKCAFPSKPSEPSGASGASGEIVPSGSGSGGSAAKPATVTTLSMVINVDFSTLTAEKTAALKKELVEAFNLLGVGEVDRVELSEVKKTARARRAAGKIQVTVFFKTELSATQQTALTTAFNAAVKAGTLKLESIDYTIPSDATVKIGTADGPGAPPTTTVASTPTTPAPTTTASSASAVAASLAAAAAAAVAVAL